MTERNYWLRTEHGRVWGPYTLDKLERLRGQLTEAAEASFDGKTWVRGVDVPELRDLLVPPRKLERPPPPRLRQPGQSPIVTPPHGQSPIVAPPQGQPRVAGKPIVTPAHGQPPVAIRTPPHGQPAAGNAILTPPPMPPVPAADAATEVPVEGDLAQVSALRLYALAAVTSASGWLQLSLEKERLLQISFRRGTPEHVSCDDQDLSLTRFLQGRGVVQPSAAREAEEQASKNGQDLLSVLFQMQLIPPSDAHRLLGEYAGFLLDRALVTFRGAFSFEKDAPPPPGAFPLGARWTLLAESVRRLDAAVLRARLGKRLLRPVVRSGGLGIGRVEELSLNALEARLYSSIDGTRTGEELLKTGDAAKTLRFLYLLSELGHLSFADSGEEAREAPKAAAPKGAAPRELPRIARPGRPPEAGARADAPPVMKAGTAGAGAGGQGVVKRGAEPPPSAPPSPSKPAAAPIAANRPPPVFASAPAGESSGQALLRLSALLERLDKADHFEALGVARQGATAAEARRNFFVLAKELHPDTVTNPADGALREVKERLFARINAASQVLGDDKRRKDYEEELDGKAGAVDVARIFAAEESFQRGEILIKARKYKEGLEHLEKAIDLNGEEAEFYAWRGYARFLLAQDRKAIFDETAADCRRAMKMQERCVPAHLFLGHMAKVTGDQKLAARCYEKVLQLEPSHVEAQRELRLMGKKG
ncbi:MAG TPA: DnaJ domain-containing protein [Myxococcales bacterium]